MKVSKSSRSPVSIEIDTNDESYYKTRSLLIVAGRQWRTFRLRRSERPMDRDWRAQLRSRIRRDCSV